MAFTEVAWANGDTITETKMDQMVASDVHVREEANYYYIANESGAHEGDATPATGTYSLQMAIDGTDYGAADTAAGAKNVSDINIGAVSAGLHTVTLTLTRGLSASSVVASYKFNKTADMAYLTWWATIHDTTGGVLTISNVAIIGHRETKSWT